MSILQRIVREPAALLGLVNALFGVLVIYGIEITRDQIGAINIFLGALVAFLRFIVTPSAEVVAQQKPGETPVAGPASSIQDGTPVQVVPRAA